MTLKQAKTIGLLSARTGKRVQDKEEAQAAQVRESLVSDDELGSLTLAFLNTRGNEAASDDTIAAVLNKVLFYRYMATCSELAAKGLVDIHFDPTQPVDEQVRFAWNGSLSQEDAKLIVAAAERVRAKPV